MSDEGYAVEGELGELVMMKPQLFTWIDAEHPEISVFINLDQVIGCQLWGPTEGNEEIGTPSEPRTLVVVMVNNVVNKTTDPDQIDRFLDMWDFI